MVRVSAASRVGVVTGGTGALGLAVVRRLLQTDGMRLWVPWLSDAEARRLESVLGRDAKRVALRRTDLTVEADVAGLFGEIGTEDGRLDFLANIAGGFAAAPLEETDGAAWTRMMTLNATTAFLCTRHAVPIMKRHGRGRVVNVASGPAINHGAANMSAYAASKAAVLNLTESLAKELGGAGITVNAIVPTVIDTPANRKAMPAADTSTWLGPDEIAAVVEFLVSDAAQIVTGTAISLSKG